MRGDRGETGLNVPSPTCLTSLLQSVCPLPYESVKKLWNRALPQPLTTWFKGPWGLGSCEDAALSYMSP